MKIVVNASLILLIFIAALSWRPGNALKGRSLEKAEGSGQAPENRIELQPNARGKAKE